MRGRRRAALVAAVLAATAASDARSHPDPADCPPDPTQPAVETIREAIQGVRRGPPSYRIKVGSIDPWKRPPAQPAPIDEQAVRELVDAVPACLLNAHGPETTIWVTPDPTDDDAHYAESSNAIQIGGGTLKGTRHWHSLFAEKLCTSVPELEEYGFSVKGQVLHEAAHSWHMGGKGNEYFDKVERFLEIRYRDRDRAYEADPRLAPIRTEAYGILGRPPEEGDHAKLCALARKEWAIHREYGFPSRFPTDMHSRKLFGNEYFAIAIETWAYQPKAFCEGFSREEQAWIERELGDCLAQIPGASPPACRR